jgi:hypothetical protein
MPLPVGEVGAATGRVSWLVLTVPAEIDKVGGGCAFDLWTAGLGFGVFMPGFRKTPAGDQLDDRVSFIRTWEMR